MIKIHGSEDPTLRQVSGLDLEGQPILSVVAKRTYTWEPESGCRRADEQVPLVQDPVADQTNPDLLIHDTDLFPYKPRTDVVVKGHAWGDGSIGQKMVSVRIAGIQKKISVSGRRSCQLGHTGRILFSRPEPIEKVPLTYAHAYGGKDHVAEEEHGNPIAEALGSAIDPQDAAMASPYLYPRNFAGRGYLLKASRRAVESLELPNLENPSDPLTPERIEVGHLSQWYQMPLPQATDWLSYEYFPRCAYLGLILFDAPVRSQDVGEIKLGFAPPSIVEPGVPTTEDIFRLTNGASLGLQVPYLKGSESCELVGLHPLTQKMEISLPGERPKLWTDGRKGKFNQTEPVLQTLIVEPDENRITMVWRGSAQALRQYHPGELERMPFMVEWPSG